MKLLTDSERAEISHAIKEAEKQTSCEIVVVEISRCDDYNSAGFAWGIIFALLSCILWLIAKASILPAPQDWVWSAGAHASAPMTVIAYPLLEWILVQALGFLAGFFLIGKIASLKRLLIPRAKMQNEANYRVESEFYRHGLYKTKEENGILIMLSVFERAVVVMADKGANSKVASDYWEAMKNRIVSGIKQNQAGRAIVEVISSAAGELKKHFPAKSEDKNELPDNVITKK
ncbi:MAG: hypothetical protein AB1599_05360 [Planctomycetota bacterium]